MAKAIDQFRASDVTVWAIVAMCAWAAAIFLANVSALFPASALAGLHASRLDGGTVNQLRLQVADIAAENARMKRENNLLLQRLDMQQQAHGEVTRRVGALEISLPDIVERIPESASIDNSVTASIGSGRQMSFEADGGTVTVEQKPLIAFQPGAAAAGPQAGSGPAVILPDGSAFGVALGFPIAADDGEVQWQGIMARVGTLLIGLEPVLAEAGGNSGEVMLVAGPFASRSQAAALCDRLDKVAIPCEPAPFKGDPLPLLN